MPLLDTFTTHLAHRWNLGFTRRTIQLDLWRQCFCFLRTPVEVCKGCVCIFLRYYVLVSTSTLLLLAVNALQVYWYKSLSANLNLMRTSYRLTSFPTLDCETYVECWVVATQETVILTR